MDKFSKLVNGIVIPKKINDEDIYKPKEVYENDFDIHEEKNVILLRYFFELLIRVAFIKFSDDPNLTIGARAKMLFDILKSYFKSKKKSGVSNTLVMIASIDPKIHNPENSVENFISTHYISLENLFNDLYDDLYNMYIVPYFENEKKNLEEERDTSSKPALRQKFQLLLALYSNQIFNMDTNNFNLLNTNKKIIKENGIES